MLGALLVSLVLTGREQGTHVNLFAPALGFNAPSAQWWTQMSSAIAGGLTFATFLTLLLTPCMLVIGGHLRREKDLG